MKQVIALKFCDEIKQNIKENNLKNIVVETGDENVYIPNEQKFVVTKDFLCDRVSIFEYCGSLEKINMENFDFSEIRTMQWWFNGCKNLQTIKFPKQANCSKLTNLSYCFVATKLQVIDLSFMKFNNNKLSLLDTFNNSSTKKIILPKCRVSNIKRSFNRCLNLQTIIAPIQVDLKAYDALYNTFQDCHKLNIIDVSRASFLVDEFVTQIKTNDNNLSEDCVIILP